MIKNIGYSCVFACLWAACSGDGGQWKKSEGMAFEFEYQLFAPKETDGAKIEAGDSVFLAYALKNQDKTIVSSYETGALVGIEVPAKMHRNSFEEPLTLAGLGDSMVVRLAVDKGGAALEQYKSSFKEGESAIFTYKIHRIKRRKENLEDKDRAYAAEMGYGSLEALYAERTWLKTKADSVDQWLKQLQETGYKDKSLPASLKTPSGMPYMLLDKGDGQGVKPQDTLFLHFALRLKSGGKELDNTFKSNHRFRYVVGTSTTLVPMWKEGLEVLSRGSKALFLVPAALGYGAAGSMPTVPPAADLVWYVEVMR